MHRRPDRESAPQSPARAVARAPRRRAALATAASALSAALLLPGPASAHRPHAVIDAVAVPADYAATGRAWMVLDPDDISQLMVTRDWGMHWDFAGGAPNDDVLVDGAYIGSMLVVGADDGSVWTTSDEGATWTEQQFPVDADLKDLAFDGSTFLVATSEGVWYGSVEDVAALELGVDGNFRLVQTSPTDPGRAAAVSNTDQVLYSETGGASFAATAGLPGDPDVHTAVHDDGVLVAGTSDGAWTYDPVSDAWDPCGALPIDDAGDYAGHVARLEVSSDGLLLAGTGEESMFVSADQCATWEARKSPLYVEYDGSGGAKGVREAVTALYLEGDLAITAGWASVYASADGGYDWEEPKVIPSDYVRGVAFAPGWPTEPRIFVGSYGGGVNWSDNSGRAWDGSAVGLNQQSVYVLDVLPAPGYATSGVVFANADRKLYASADEGQTWSSVGLGLSELTRLRADGGRLYAIGNASDAYGIQPRVFYTEDDGATWDEMDSVYDALDTAGAEQVVTATVGGVAMVLVATNHPAGLLKSTDGGATWSWAWEGGRGSDAEVAVWPATSPTRIVIAAQEEGVLLSNNGGASWFAPLVPPEGRVRELVRADDGTLFLANLAGKVYRSIDGGRVWTSVATPLAPAVFEMAASPDFAVNRTLLIGTYAGVYYSTDLAATLPLLRRFERFEDHTYHFHCRLADDSGDCARYDNAAQGRRGGFRMANGDTLEFTFHGTEFTVLGPLTGQGALRVVVDGAVKGALVAGVNGRLSGLSAAWHDVTLTAVTTTALQVDAVKTLGSGTPIPRRGP